LNILRVQGGAAGVTYGNLLSLPVAGGLLYVEPVYVKAAGGSGSYPLLQKVLVSFGNNIGFQSTYSAAIASLVGAPPGSSSSGSTGTGAGPTSSAPPGSTSPSPSGSVSPSQAASSTVVPTDLAQDIAAAQQAYADGQAALKAGDFTAYGQAQQRLAAALAKAETVLSPSPSATSSPTAAVTAPSASP
jgi:uncharacterized membrane protein (UPF0182 family)